MSDADTITTAGNERTYTAWMHASVLALSVTGGLAIIMPIVMWQSRRGQSAFIDDHGREAVNFHISLIVYSVLASILFPFTCGLSAFAAVGVVILGIVGSIRGIEAGRSGRWYRYPMCMRLLQAPYAV
ncbi:MAG: DUF4870 domain-containing protein [Planctomycetota bacterium]